MILAHDISQLFAGLVGYFRLNGNANDATTLSRGTAQGALTYVAGIANLAAKFESVNNTAVSTGGNYNFIQSTGIFTVNLWLNPATEATDTNIFRNTINSANNGIRIYRSGNTGLVCFLRSGATQTSSPTIPSFFTTGVWQMLTVIGNGSQFKIYKNGVLSTTQGYDSFVPTVSSSQIIADIGSLFNGLIEEASIFNRVLTDEEIAILYNIGAAHVIGLGHTLQHNGKVLS